MTFADAAEPDRTRGVRVLVSAASRHGSTSDFAEVIAQVLSEGLTVTVLPPKEVQSIEKHDAALIGSAVYVAIGLIRQLRIRQLAIHELAIHQIVDNFVGDFLGSARASA